MDWNKLREQATEFGKKTLDTSMSYLEKTAGWSYEWLKKTPFFLKDGAGFDLVRNEKLLVIFVLGKEDPISRSILVQFPVILSKAWIVSATLKTILSEESNELLWVLQANTPSVMIYRKGELIRRVGADDIKEFLKEFDVSDPRVQAETENVVTSAPETTTEAPASTITPSDTPPEKEKPKEVDPLSTL